MVGQSVDAVEADGVAGRLQVDGAVEQQQQLLAGVEPMIRLKSKNLILAYHDILTGQV